MKEYIKCYFPATAFSRQKTRITMSIEISKTSKQHIDKLLKKQVNIDGEALAEVERKNTLVSQCQLSVGVPKPINSKTENGIEIEKIEKNAHNILPPNKGTSLLGFLLQTPSIEKA